MVDLSQKRKNRSQKMFKEAIDMETIANRKTFRGVAPLGQTTRSGRNSNVQVLYLGDNGKLTYAGSGRTVSKKLSEKLGISKFNFF